MTTDIDFHQIGEDLTALIRNNVTGFKSVLHEPDSIQVTAFNTPLCYVTMEGDGNSEPRASGSYYDTWSYTVEIVTIDLTSWASAAKARTALFRQARNIVRLNSRFAGDLDASWLGAYEFERAVDRDEESWFAAVARFQVRCAAYYDR